MRRDGSDSSLVQTGDHQLESYVYFEKKHIATLTDAQAFVCPVDLEGEGKVQWVKDSLVMREDSSRQQDDDRKDGGRGRFGHSLSSLPPQQPLTAGGTACWAPCGRARRRRGRPRRLLLVQRLGAGRRRRAPQDRRALHAAFLHDPAVRDRGGAEATAAEALRRRERHRCRQQQACTPLPLLLLVPVRCLSLSSSSCRRSLLISTATSTSRCSAWCRPCSSRCLSLSPHLPLHCGR